MVDVLLTELAEVSRAVSQTSARLAKVAALADGLRAASAEEVPVLVAYLSGELPQRQIGVGWAALRSVPPPAESGSLSLLAVDEAFSRIKAVAGKGSAAERKRLVDELFAAATADEQFFLVRLLSGELRQGALDGVMTDAVARAAGVPGPRSGGRSCSAGRWPRPRRPRSAAAARHLPGSGCRSAGR